MTYPGLQWLGASADSQRTFPGKTGAGIPISIKLKLKNAAAFIPGGGRKLVLDAGRSYGIVFDPTFKVHNRTGALLYSFDSSGTTNLAFGPLLDFMKFNLGFPLVLGARPQMLSKNLLTILPPTWLSRFELIEARMVDAAKPRWSNPTATPYCPPEDSGWLLYSEDLDLQAIIEDLRTKQKPPNPDDWEWLDPLYDARPTDTAAILSSCTRGASGHCISWLARGSAATLKALNPDTDFHAWSYTRERFQFVVPDDWKLTELPRIYFVG